MLGGDVTERKHSPAVEEDTIEFPQRVVTRGAVHAEARIEGLFHTQDLLHEQPAIRADERTELLQIAEGISQAIGVIHANTVDDARGDELVEDAVRVFKDHRIFLPHTRETVDAEETAIVDDAIAPEHELVVLPVVDLLRGAAFGTRTDGEAVLVVDQLVALDGEGRHVILAAEHGQSQPASCTVVVGPVDVEVRGKFGVLPILQHVPPPGVELGNIHSDVVGHDIEQDLHAGFVDSVGQLSEPFHAAQFGIDGGRISDVIAVGGFRRCRHDGGQVQVAHPELLEVFHLLSGIGEGKRLRRVGGWAAKLQTVGGRHDPQLSA